MSKEWTKAHGQKETGVRRITALGIIGIAVLLSVPLFVNYCLEGTELTFHLLRIEGLKDGLLAGQFPVRIQPNWLEGRGYAVSLFEGDTFLLIPALLRMAGVPVQTAYQIFLCMSNLAAATIAYVCFRSLLQDRLLGFLGSLFYTCSPYRIYVLYGKADLGEILAILFLPMVFVGMLKILQDKPEGTGSGRAWLLPALGLTAMFQSHITSFELAVMMSVLLCLFHGKKAFTAPKLLLYGKILAVVIVGNAWMIVPLLNALVRANPYIRYAGALPIQQRGVYVLHYLIAFWRSGTFQDIAYDGMRGMVPGGIGFAVTVLLLGYLWVRFTGRYREERKQSLLWKLAGRVSAAGGILLLMSTANFPWDILRQNRLLRVLTAGLQSPMELLPYVTICFAFTGCVLLGQVRSSEGQWWPWILSAVVALSLLTTQFLTNDYLQSREPLYLYDSTQLDTNQILEGAYLPMDEETGGAAWDEDLAARLDVHAWYWRASEILSAASWTVLGIYLVVTGRSKHGKENEYVEEIRSA